MVSLLSRALCGGQCYNEQLIGTFRPSLDPTSRYPTLNGGQLCISGPPAIGHLLTTLPALALWRVIADTGVHSSLTVPLRQAAGPVLSGRNSHASPPRRLESLKPTLPHHVGTRDGGPSWKNPAFPFPDGPKKGDPIRSRGTTKVDGMKRLGGAFGTCFSGKEGPLFPPSSSGPKSVCHLRPSGGNRSSAAAFRDFSTRLLPLYRPQSTVKTTRPCLFFCFREEGVARFLPLHSLVPRSRLNPRRRRRHPLPSLLLSDNSLVPPSHRLFCHTTYGTIPVAC